MCVCEGQKKVVVIHGVLKVVRSCLPMLMIQAQLFTWQITNAMFDVLSNSYLAGPENLSSSQHPSEAPSSTAFTSNSQLPGLSTPEQLVCTSGKADKQCSLREIAIDTPLTSTVDVGCALLQQVGLVPVFLFLYCALAFFSCIEAPKCFWHPPF